jgi:hypothetical protein
MNTVLESLQTRLERLCHEALRSGVVLTVELEPKQPLAMGSYRMLPSARYARGAGASRMVQDPGDVEIEVIVPDDGRPPYETLVQLSQLLLSSTSWCHVQMVGRVIRIVGRR